jgi:hypothetical protein
MRLDFSSYIIFGQQQTRFFFHLHQVWHQKCPHKMVEQSKD